MSRGSESFLTRWARQKRASATPAPATPAPATPAAAATPDLPPVESLSFESDFSAFMREKVNERIKRAALKKLFTDPRFNVMDGLDIYIDDYSVEDPIPPGVLAQLQHARSTLLGAQPEAEAKRFEDTKFAVSPLDQTALEPPVKDDPSEFEQTRPRHGAENDA